MAQALPLPDGTTVAIREGETPAQTWARAQQMYPEAFGMVPEKAMGAGPESGFVPAVKAGFSGLKSDIAALAGRSGIMDLAAAEKYRAEQEQYQKETFKPTETWSEAPFTKFKELAGGSLPYMAAPLAAGALPILAAPAAAAGTAATIGGIAATTLGMGLAGATSAAQFTGSGLSRQVKEGTKLGETELGSAVAAAIPSAALDMVSFKMMPGIRQLFAAAGKEVSEQGARKIAEQGIKETLKDYGAATVKTMGVEGITEAGQQVLERLQAGLNLTDEKARDEYLESFIGGAVLGGALAPVGRRIERGSEAGAQQKEAALEKRAAAEEAQRAAKLAADADKEYKQSAPYALQVEQEYMAAEQAKAALKAQIRPITKGSPTETADKAFNTNIYNQIKDQAPELRKLGAEYSRLEPVLKQAKEAQRVAGMTPEEYMLEQMMQQMQQEGVPATGRARRLAALNTPIEPEEAAPTPEAAYAADRLALAREQTAITGDIAQDASDYVAYLMTDPAMAQAIVDNQTPLPDFTRKEQNVVRGALKLQLDAREKQRVAAGQAGTAAGQTRIGTVEEEEAAAIEAQRAADEAEAARLSAERADTERQIRIAPEVEGIQRLGKAPEGTWNAARADQLRRSLDQKQMDENQIDKLLATLPMSAVIAPGHIYAGMGFESASRRDLLTRMAVAKAHAGVEDVTQLAQELASMDAQPSKTAEAAANLPGASLLPEVEKKTVQAENLADQQSQTLREFIRFLEDRKRGVIRGTIRGGRQERLAEAGTAFKDAYANQHLDELKTRLEAFGLPLPTETEAKLVKGRVMRNLNELEKRWTAPETAPTGRGAFGAPMQALEVLQEDMRASMFSAINNIAARLNDKQAAIREERMGPRPPMQYKSITNKPIEVPRAEQGVRFSPPKELTLKPEPTLQKDDRRVALETAQKLLATFSSPEQYGKIRGYAPERTQAIPEELPPASRGTSSRAEMAEVFGAPRTGRDTDLQSRVAYLDKDTKAFVRLANDMLPEITDPALVARIKEDLQGVVEGRGLTPLVQQDLKDFAALRARASESTTRPGATAEELQRTSAQPQMELPGMEAPATITQRATPSNFQKMLDSKDVQGMRAAIVKKAEDAVRLMQEVAASTPRALRLARLAEARAKQEAALTDAQRLARESLSIRKADAQALKEAEQEVANLQQAVDTLERLRTDDIPQLKALLAKEPENMALLIRAPYLLSKERTLIPRLTAAKTALAESQALLASIQQKPAAPVVAETKAAEERLTETKKELTAAQKDIEAKRYEEAPPVTRETRAQDEFREALQRGREGLNLPGIRRLVDTTKMKTQIAQIRSAMGSFDAQLETEKDPAKKAEIQAKRDNAAKALETVYADAPRITTEIKESDQQTFEAAFDDAQAAAYDKVMARRRVRGGEYGPALVSRRQGMVTRQGNSARVVQTGEKRATPATEMAGSALERVAQERAALAELEAREKFLRDNGKAKSGGRLTEAFKALQAKTEKQRAVVRQVEAAQKATVAAVRDVNKEERAAKAKPGYGGGAVFRTSTRGPTSLKTEQVERLAKRMTSDWVNAPEIVVVADETGLPQSIQDQAARDEKTGAIPGVYDPNTKTVYLVASNLTDGHDVILTIAHEATGHFGLREVMGTTYAATMNRLYAGNATVREKADAKQNEAPGLSREIAVEEVLADMAETGGETAAEKSALRRIYEALRDVFRKVFKLPNVTDAEVRQIVADARQYVIEGGTAGKGAAQTGEAVRRTKAATGAENALTSLTDTLVAKPKTFKERVGNNFGLEFEMQTTDMRAGLREALKAGAAEMGDDTRFTQAMYSVIKADQRMPLVQAALTNGAPELYTDEKGFIGVRSSNKNSAKDVFEAIAEIPGRNSEEKVNLFTTYMAVQRAVNKGLTRLDAGGLGITPEKVEAAMAVVDADPALKKALDSARSAYNAFNKGLIEFVASIGAIPKAVAKTLLKDGDYVPFYRVDDNGMADLVFSDEVIINIGDIRHQPYLAQLKGGETKILPLNESLPRNTLLLMDLALTTMAARHVAYAMQAVGEGRGAPDKSGKPTDLMSIRKGQAPAGPNIVTFSQEPDPKDPKDNGRRWLRVETAGTAMEGIPSELVVKSLEGAHLTLPAFLKLGGVAGDWLRAGVTRMPMYLARQLIRDPMAAAFTGGLNYGPLRAVAKAGKEFIAMSRGTSETGAKLVEKGLIQSGIFTGDPSDLSKIALQLSSGKDQGVVNRLFAMLDRAAMRADAATRTQVYDNAIANGLSEVEADMMVMESMNFYKRGLSPTVQYASRLIPFFNAQIQGLNVLYKAARGQMPFEEQQQIQRKFFNNAMLLVGVGVVYAMAMEDDPYFKNAKPRDKYSNFFLPIPGVEEPFKLPIPYEAGWFFSLAVAAVDAMKKETDTPQQFKALRDIFLSSVPGYSSAGMPQLVKPAFEVWTNKNFFSGQNIESARLENVASQERFKASTTEAAKALSKALPMLSPIQIEHLASGYFGQLPLIIAGATDSLFRKTEKGAAPEKRTTDLPFIGQAFQKKYGGADVDVMYREAGEAIEAKATFEKIRKEGRVAEAQEFLADNRAEVASAGLAQNFRKVMGRLRDDESRITNMPNMSAKEKRARIDKLDEARQDIAQKYEAALKRIEQGAGRTTPR
jgi:hypothetical protein